MAKTGVLGNGPISFFNTATRGQVSIPLSALIFDGGKLTISQDAGRADLTALLGSGLSTWLDYQVSQGFVSPAPSTPAAQALVFKAADAGVTGNDVTVAIAYSSGTPKKYTATATKIDRYTGLTKDNIVSILGMGAKVGSQPGLVQVKDQPLSTLTLAPNPTVSGPAPAGDVGKQAGFTVTFSAGNTLTFLASKAGVEGNDISITVSDVVGATFSLTATWTKATAAIDTTVPTPATAFDVLGYVLKVSAPPSGTLGLPQAGLYTLSGGADAAPAATATATALTPS
jgi:hypothetical protein